MRGEITQIGNRFVVTQGKQDEVGVPVASVAWRCTTLHEAYQCQRAALPIHATAAQHLELGDWCLRYELFTAAAEELMAAQRLAPDNPQNERFEKRLRLAAHRCTAPKAASPPRKTSTVTQSAHAYRT